MPGRAPMLELLGGEAGCRRLSGAFYARVGKDPALRRLFPGKSLRCAAEEFAAFLVQFLGGDEDEAQARWWLSLRESHARFLIESRERSAWLKQMSATLDAAPLDAETRDALRQFFEQGSSYIRGTEAAAPPAHEELAARWSDQCLLDDLCGAIAAGRDDEALALAPRFALRPPVFVGLLARMMASGRASLILFVVNAVTSDPTLSSHRFHGRVPLHFASATGCVEVLAPLLRPGANPDVRDRGGHTPLYCVANECASPAGPEVVRRLVEAGADVNACGGVTQATALHMAARRGCTEIARALLECGAFIDARDRKGDTPLQRAINCRRKAVAQFLLERGASSRGM